MIGSFRDQYNGIITKMQRNFRLCIGFLLLFTWFIWPVIAVGVAESLKNTSNDRVDFVCDVVSWCMKMFSFFVFIAITHPVNPNHERTFDFNKEMIHARYVKNSIGDGDQIFNESDDDDDDNDAGTRNTKSELQMNEIKKSTVFSTKMKEKKKKGKLFKYGGRNQIAEDSEDDDSDELSDQNINDDEDDRDNIYQNKGNNIAVSAVSFDAAKETLKGGE